MVLVKVCFFVVKIKTTRGDYEMAKQEFVKEITSRDVDFPQWYTDVVLKAELAAYSGVKGSMIVRPTGTAIWENIRNAVDSRIKETGHENVMMPLLIPEHLLLKEAEHVEGFAPEVAWVTHGGESELGERLAIRPTSEVLFAEHFRDIIKSYRDLPKLYNQWANVVRWEKTTRPFLRTTEFFWQEGHTCHETFEEADQEARQMLDVYTDVCENILAIPVISGNKTQSEKFAGAEETYTNETLMYDGKALQLCTSHHLGDNFSKAYDIKFLDREGKEQNPQQTSWGLTTRTIGALIMVHSDDRGLVLPPRVAPTQVMIIPVMQHKEGVLDAAGELMAQLKTDFSVKMDDSDKKPGWKFNECEMRGIPVRIEIGPRDIENKQVTVMRRDTLEKMTLPLDANLNQAVTEILDEIHVNMFESAKKRQEEKMHHASTKEEFLEAIEKGGFVVAPYSGDEKVEAEIKELTGATPRVIRFEDQSIDLTGVKDFWNGEPAKLMVHWAKAY